MEPARLLTLLVQARADARTAVTWDGGHFSWQELVQRTVGVADALAAEGTDGIAAGDRVAIFAEPSGLFVAALLGVLLRGGVAIVLSPLHPPAESQYFLADSGAVAILVDAAFRDRAAALGVRTIPLESLAAIDVIPSDLEARVANLHPSRPAVQLYTSGTTGKPKGAVLSHENLGVQARILGELWRMKSSDTLLHALPLHHMHGLCISLLTALFARAHVRFLPGFDAGRIWKELAHASVFMAVPTMYQRLLARFEQADDEARTEWRFAASALRLATSGSAALPVTLAERWRALTGSIPLERFGMTEIGVGLSNPFDEAGRVAGSVGFPPPTVETRVLGDMGRPAEQGELLVRGPSVFLGYHRREEATREAFEDDADGGAPWFRTGDTVVRGSDGRFRILGRTSVDILKSGGYKLSALEIEEAIREHPAVAEVAVVGVPDEAWGERVVACVIPRDGRRAECDREPLRAFLRDKLAAYKLPKDVVLMEDFPRTSLGKVQKKLLAEALKAP